MGWSCPARPAGPLGSVSFHCHCFGGSGHNLICAWFQHLQQESLERLPLVKAAVLVGCVLELCPPSWIVIPWALNIPSWLLESP